MFLPSQYPSPTSGVLLTLPVFLFIPRWTDPVFLHGEGGGGIKSHPHPELFSVRGVMTMVGFILLTLGMSIPLSPPRAGVCWAVATGVSPMLSSGTRPSFRGHLWSQGHPAQQVQSCLRPFGVGSVHRLLQVMAKIPSTRLQFQPRL